jgi:hypothetical protein
MVQGCEAEWILVTESKAVLTLTGGTTAPLQGQVRQKSGKP